MRKVLFFIILSIFLCGCANDGYMAEEVTIAENADSSSEKTAEEALLARDTAVVLAVDTDKRTIVLQTAESGRRYEVSYDGLTYFYDEYGKLITADFLECGDIVRVSVSVHSAYLSELTLDKDIFTVKESGKYSINENKKMFTVNGENYKLPQRLVVLVDGSLSDISEINSDDVVTVKGIDRMALVCLVERGTGTLKLKGETPFIGGWIEIGDIIKPIQEKQELQVPEGEYEMRISYHGRSSIKTVSITRGEETKIDISDLKDSIIQSGMVSFMIAPSDAKLCINGEETDYLLPVELEYGVYRMTVSSRGYETINQYISVHKKSLDIEVTLLPEGAADNEKDEEKKKDRTSSASGKAGNIDYVMPDRSSSTMDAAESPEASSSVNSSSASEADKTETGSTSEAVSQTSEGELSEVNAADTENGGYIYIEKPKKTEVYFDGDYKGIIPISFKKIPGSHVITLRRDGYKTKSYTVTIEDNEEDQTYEFGKLKEDDE